MGFWEGLMDLGPAKADRREREREFDCEDPYLWWLDVRARGRRLQGVDLLSFAVLERAVLDVGTRTSDVKESSRLSAIAWFRSLVADSPFSFVHVAERLGFDPSAVRRAVLEPGFSVAGRMDRASTQRRSPKVRMSKRQWTAWQKRKYAA